MLASKYEQTYRPGGGGDWFWKKKDRRARDRPERDRGQIKRTQDQGLVLPLAKTAVMLVLVAIVLHSPHICSLNQIERTTATTKTSTTTTTTTLQQ